MVNESLRCTRLAALAWTLALAAACTAGSSSNPAPFPAPGPTPPSSSAGQEVLVGAGDIAWCGLDGGALTASLLDQIQGTVFTTGDHAYPLGTLADFQRCYEATWGRHKARTRPVPGNHDYGDGTTDGADYFTYFGPNAGPPGLGYYSYQLGAWHIVALDSEISAFPGSPQMTWLRADLAANSSQCTLAIFHTPVFGSGTNGSNPHMQVAWRSLYDSGVDVVVNGHNHSYERFAPQNPDGGFDPARGIREFVVGTGGAQLTGFPRIQANSEVRSSTWGVLKLTLSADRYDWEFVSVAGQSFSDSGGASCH